MPGKAKTADVLPMRRVVAMISYLRGEGKLRDAALVAVAAGFGLRIGDALSLTWEDVLDEMGEVRPQLKLTEQKTGKTRIVRVFPFVRRALEEWRDATGYPSGYIFPGRNGGPLSRKAAWLMLKKTADAMGIRGQISPHSLRKAFCDFVYEHTRDPVQTARITGHTNPAQLLRYIGRMAEGEKETWDRMEKALARAGV